MIEALEQLLVSLKAWGLEFLDPALRPVVSALISAATIIGVFASLFALTTLLERKGLGRIQNRLGPNRTGPFGILQPLADGLKMLTKEDIVPSAADRVVHFLAPLAMVIPVLLAYAVLPFGKYLVAADFDAGVLFFFAAGASTELSVFMAGWASRNKFSIFGAMRAIAQMISYEIPLVLGAMGAVMTAGSMSLTAIVDSQAGYHAGILARWNVFTPWGLAGFLFFLIAATAESNRTPFDIPEGESEIIAGHLVEYSGFKYALFFLGEYLGLFSVSGLAITLFLGGWRAPFSFLDWIPSYFWFFGKLLCMIALYIWLRGTLPRLRSDQLMNFAWKFLLPMVLVNLVAAGVWISTSGWGFAAAPLVRWVLCGLIVLVPYVRLGEALYRGRKFGPRTYILAS